MTIELAERPRTNGLSAASIETALIGGDLGKLNTEQRLAFYNQVCQSLGLNPLTKPFEYITLNGKLTFYARKDCTEQLRNIRQISITILAREEVAGCYVVTARASNAAGRTDESIGAVPIEGLKGEARANALMKAETKAKRRVTLSISGLGMLDETEAETIQPSQQTITVEPLPDQPTPVIPAGTHLVTSVEKVPWTSGTRSGVLWRVSAVNADGETIEATTFTEPLATLAGEVCQVKEPVVLETKAAKNGGLDLVAVHRQKAEPKPLLDIAPDVASIAF